MRKLTHIDRSRSTKLTACLLGLIYSLVLIGQSVHRHDGEYFSHKHNSYACHTNQGEHDEEQSDSQAHLVSNIECHICEFHLGMTDRCAMAPSFAPEEWDETPPTVEYDPIYPALREGKALRAPPVRYYC